ncbi:hypothetical protein VaNZ11_009326 [Volvox africanus]|uniref:Uncharacterized protein n=1 Tax=Volvox africanus TaxID=51714 RepID=A0ABQ5S8A7_9CHLO|nr:hypothetical protein VaNZ11_009326 [Volvox africanus]
MVLHVAAVQSLLFDEHPRQNPDDILRQARISHNSSVAALHVATSVNTVKPSLTRIQYELGSSLPYDYVSKGSSITSTHLSKATPKTITVKEVPRFGSVMAALPSAAASTSTDFPTCTAASTSSAPSAAAPEVTSCSGCYGDRTCDGRSATAVPVAAYCDADSSIANEEIRDADAANHIVEDVVEDIVDDVEDDDDDDEALSHDGGTATYYRKGDMKAAAAASRIAFLPTRHSASTSQPGVDMPPVLAAASARVPPGRRSATDIPGALLYSSRPLFPTVGAEVSFLTPNMYPPHGGSSGRRASRSCTGDPRDALQAFSSAAAAAAAGQGGEESGRISSQLHYSCSGGVGPPAALPPWSAFAHSLVRKETAAGPGDETRPSPGEWVLGRGRGGSSRAFAARLSATSGPWRQPAAPTASNYGDVGSFATGEMSAEEGMCDMADISAVSTGVMNGFPGGDVAAATGNVGPSHPLLQRHLFKENGGSQMPQVEGPNSSGSTGYGAATVRPTPTPAPPPLQCVPPALPGQLLEQSPPQDGPNSAPPGSPFSGRYNGMHAYGAAACDSVLQHAQDPATAPASAGALLPRMSAARARQAPLSPAVPAAYPAGSSDSSPAERPISLAAGVAALFEVVAPGPPESFASPPRASGRGGTSFAWGNSCRRSTSGAEFICPQGAVVRAGAMAAGPDSGLVVPRPVDPAPGGACPLRDAALGCSVPVDSKFGVDNADADLTEAASPFVVTGEQQQQQQQPPPRTSACKSHPSSSLLSSIGSGGGGGSSPGAQVLPAPSPGLKPTPLVAEDRQLPPRPASQSQGTRPLFPPPALQPPPSPHHRGHYNSMGSGGQSPSSPQSPVQQQQNAFTKRTPSQAQMLQQAWRRTDGKPTHPSMQPPAPSTVDGENQWASSHGSPASTASSVTAAGDPAGSGSRRRFSHLSLGAGLGAGLDLGLGTTPKQHSYHSHTPRSSHNVVQPLGVPGPALDTPSPMSSVATSRAGTSAAPPSSCSSIGGASDRRAALPGRGYRSLEITPEEHQNIMARMKAALSFLHRGH